MVFGAFNIFIQNFVEFVCHFARSHSTYKNNPYVIIHSVLNNSLSIHENSETLQVLSIGGQVFQKPSHVHVL